MTDKARELLERALNNWDHPVSDKFSEIFEEIRAYLAQPEVKPEALSEDEIKELWWKHALPLHEDEAPREQFIRFTRAVEKHHGIGGGDE